MNRYRLIDVEVVDGDTIESTIILGHDLKWLNRRIRFSGIDAYEVRVRKSWTKGLSVREIRGRLILGLRAKNHVVEKLTSADSVSLQSELKQDNFGRFLGVIYYTKDGQEVNLNQELVSSGVAIKKDY